MLTVRSVWPQPPPLTAVSAGVGATERCRERCVVMNTDEAEAEEEEEEEESGEAMGETKAVVDAKCGVWKAEVAGAGGAEAGAESGGCGLEE